MLRKACSDRREITRGKRAWIILISDSILQAHGWRDLETACSRMQISAAEYRVAEFSRDARHSRITRIEIRMSLARNAT